MVGGAPLPAGGLALGGPECGDTDSAPTDATLDTVEGMGNACGAGSHVGAGAAGLG